jgi:hypothetical protein
MSITTLRKRIAVVAVSALTAGMLTLASSPAANATHPTANGAAGTNGNPATLSTIGNHLFVATQANSGSTAAAATNTAAPAAAYSKGLLSKDTSSGTAQTVTLLTGGVLSLYANVSTAVTFSASAGSFSSVAAIATAAAHVSTYAPISFATYNSANTKSWLNYTTFVSGLGDANESRIATGVAALWTAPTTAGTYTVSMSTGYVLQSNATTYSAPSSSNGDSPTLVGAITVSVVASSSGGSYSAAYSSCRTAVNTATSYNALVTTNPNVDSTGAVKNGDQWSIDFDLNDAYAADLDSGNLVVTATNGALVNLGTAGTTPVAGTAATDVEFGSASSRTVRIDQPTAGAPLTTTVTITYNGTTVCTKTVTIRGKVAKIAVAHVGTQDLSGTGGSVQWIYEQIGLSSAGMFTVLATDSVGNIVATDGLGTFSADAATLTTTVQAVTFPTLSTSTSSTSTGRYTLGSFQCAATAGSSSIKIKFTTTSTGEAITSDAFTARCADNPDTYTVSLDKASYKQGDIATATVQFLDSKGNKANSVTAVGANSWVLPYFSPVTFSGTLAAGASATAVTKADGSVTYTFTVGTTTAVENGSYAGVITYDVPANGVKQTVQYSLTRGGDTTTNADVLKSIVALIASINKQIQALQKLILQRK